MITADQLIAHGVGDYILQSDWMANNKTKSWIPAAIHGFSYAIPFLFFTYDWRRLVIIAFTHALIDRFRLARYLVWAKNWLGPNKPWSECSKTGYPDDKPVWLAVWLMIIADNICHILINGWVL